MHRIYHNATRVVIWLGDSSDTSGYGLALIRQALGIHKKTLQPTPDSIFHPDVSKEQRSSDEIALMEIFGRPWWKRVWVIQEAAYARSSIFMCGQDLLDISWNDLLWAHRKIEGSVSAPCKLSIDCLMIFNVTMTRLIIASKDWKSSPMEVLGFPLIMLKMSRNFLAKDHRDHIFAMLNMGGANESSSSGRKLIPVDYNMDTATVFINTAIALTGLKEVHLDVLSSVEFRTDEMNFPCHSAADPKTWARRVRMFRS